MELKNIHIVVGLIITLVTITVAIDARYLHEAQAGELFSQQAIEVERGDLETKLELIELELKHINVIRGYSEREAEEAESRKEYLEQRRIIIENRLMDLKKAK